MLQLPHYSDDQVSYESYLTQIKGTKMLPVFQIQNQISWL